MINNSKIFIDIKNTHSILKLEYLYNNKIFKTNLIVSIFIFQYLGYHVFIKNEAFNSLNIWYRIIYIFIHYTISWSIIKITLTEFGLLKEKVEKGSKSISELLLKTKNKYQKKSKIDCIEDTATEVNRKQDHLLLIKDEFLSIKDFIKKSENRITKIERHIFPKEKIKINCSTEEIKSLFGEYKQDLFQNLDVNNFIKYMFKGESKISENNLYEDEINNILAIMTLLIQEGVIKNNSKSVLYRLAKPYFKLGVELQMFGIDIKKKKYRLTDEKIQSYIIKQITNFKII